MPQRGRSPIEARGCLDGGQAAGPSPRFVAIARVRIPQLDTVTRAHYHFGREVTVDVRSPHEQHTRKNTEEGLSYPGRHRVRGGRTKVHVQHYHDHDDGKRHEDHGEEEVFPDEGNDERSRGNNLGQEEEEDGEREKDGDREGDLLPAV